MNHVVKLSLCYNNNNKKIIMYNPTYIGYVFFSRLIGMTSRIYYLIFFVCVFMWQKRRKGKAKNFFV